MKKLLVISLLMVFVVTLSAELLPQKTETVKADFSTSVRPQKQLSREVPDWEWKVVPQDLLTNYADYFQCYNQTPISLQPADHGDGIYIIYRVKDQAGTSEISFTYIDADGNVVNSAGIGATGYYSDAQVDPATGDVFGTWHVALDDGSGTYDCIAIYDLYHIIGGPGLWKDPPITVLDSDLQNDLDPTADDEFIWPQIAIGPSPTPGKNRIYIVASNHIEADGTQGNPSENVMIMMADYDQTDIEMQSNLEWSYNTVPMFDNWNEENPDWYRPFKSFTVIDNQLIFMGFRIPGDSLPDDPEELFCIINDNYGEGTDWQEYYAPTDFVEENPSWEHNGETWYLYSDLTNWPDGPASEPYPNVWQGFVHTGHFNLVPTRDNTAVTFAGGYGVTFDIDPEDPDNSGLYKPLWFQIYPKTVTFDLMTQQFKVTDVYPQGANPDDNDPARPWDLDEDGEIDSFEDDGFPEWAQDWPIFHYDTENAFHYNEYFLTANEEEGWMAYLWVDGMMAMSANEGWEGYESWTAKPELALCVSNDWGSSWSDPIFLNANTESENFDVELSDMIPCFAYPGDKIEVDADDDEYGIVHLFFLDDNDYGSFHSQSHGLNNGSTFEYAALKVYFGHGAKENNELAAVPVTVKNYPNPFNPVTNIQFESNEAGDVTIDIYNVKGQKIRSLVNDTYDAGVHHVTWNGTNDNGSEVPSGVYFYKTKFGKYTTSKKMILMK